MYSDNRNPTHERSFGLNTKSTINFLNTLPVIFVLWFFFQNAIAIGIQNEGENKEKSWSIYIQWSFGEVGNPKSEFSVIAV